MLNTIFLNSHLATKPLFFLCFFFKFPQCYFHFKIFLFGFCFENLNSLRVETQPYSELDKHSITNKQEEKRKQKIRMICTWWLSRTLDLLLGAFLRCRTLVDVNVLLCICTSLLCAGPIAGCSAVLVVRRYLLWLRGYRCFVCPLGGVRSRFKNKTKKEKKTV